MAHYEVFDKTQLHTEVFYSRDCRKAEQWVAFQPEPDKFVIREVKPLSMDAFPIKKGRHR